VANYALPEINKKQISKEELESFNNEIINVFSRAEYKGLLTTNEYKVLTSCHYYQECMELVPTFRLLSD